MLNIFSGHLMAIMNNVSVWWHVVGAAAIVLILIFVPDQHQRFSYVFTERFNNSGLRRRQHQRRSASGSSIVPFGFLLTQYTITGFDASAHLSEETASASKAAAKGIWRSIFYSVHRRLHPAAVRASSRSRTTHRAARQRAGRRRRGAYIFARRSGSNWATFVLFISAVGAVLLRDVVHDVGVADDLRVQPRRRHPRLEALVEADRQPGARPTR